MTRLRNFTLLILVIGWISQSCITPRWGIFIASLILFSWLIFTRIVGTYTSPVGLEQCLNSFVYVPRVVQPSPSSDRIGGGTGCTTTHLKD